MIILLHSLQHTIKNAGMPANSRIITKRNGKKKDPTGTKLGITISERGDYESYA